MGKGSAQDPKDQSIQQKIRQYLITARKLPSENEKEPKIIQMRVFARNTVSAQTKFWYQMRCLNKLKKSHGEVIAINEIFEKNTRAVRIYGIVIRYQSRTGYHNMYREYRDVSVNGAMSQLFSEMSGNHRANSNTIHVLRTCIVNKSKDVKRARTIQWRNSKVKFPIIKTIPRSSQKKFRTVFKATRPNLYRCA